MQEAKKNNFLKGAAILAATGVFVKIVGAIYQIPILREMGDEGAGYFHVTYMVYAFILAISTAGVPVAMSRLVSSAAARGDSALIKRYFSVALPAFILIGLAAMLLMFFFADNIADLMNTSQAAYSIRVLSPAVFFVCIIAVYRGYAQGFGNMVPTAASQIVEVVSKAAFGIAVVFYLSRLNYEAQFVSAGAITGVTIGLGLCIPLLMWYKMKMDRELGGRQGDGSSVLETTPGSAEPPPSCAKGARSKTDEPSPCPPRMQTFLRIMKVSIPISLSASFMSIMGVIDTSVVSNRLQSALMLTESGAMAQLGIFRKGLSIYNLPPSLVVPLAVSIIPAIAGAIAQNNKKEASSVVQSSVKLTNLFAMPACAGIMVLAGPILNALYYDPSQTPEAFATMTTILVILGAASYFVCFQHLTIAVLQANGYERVALITFPVGAAVKIALSYFLVGNPNFGIIGSPIGTLACFLIIVTLNVIFITVKVKERFKFISGFLKPLICAVIMAGISYMTYEGAQYLGAGFPGTGYTAVIIYLAAAIIVGVIVYTALVVITRTITRDDLMHIPKGDKLAKLLKVR